MGIVIAFLMAFSVFTTSVDDNSFENNSDTTTINEGGANITGGDDWDGGI